ncbi:JAB domain-containing protein [Belliella marina]|uniref:JAB domain-containing protein n=1 Tax=Belliella marina TaxID=1644146 RepID=A0ABW4VTK3_9BACT
MIVAHNHPSGSPKPNHMDQKLTDELRIAWVILIVLGNVIILT